MATATNNDSRKSVDHASVFADPAAIHEVLDDVFAEMPQREALQREEPVAPLLTQPTAVRRKPADRPVQVAYQPRPRTRVPADDNDSDWFCYAKQTICVGLMLLGAVLFYRGMPSSWRAAINPFGDSPAVTASSTPTSHAASDKRLITKPIQDARVGDRIVGRNPIREQADLVEPDPATWRKISLFMTKESGLGLWMDLLRPLTWIEEHNAKPGRTIFIDLYEMGAVGDAEVTYVGPCPKIQPGTGTVVIGTFKHQADENTNVVHLKLEDQIELTGVTDNHPYWSADRQDFVEVGRLRTGELVDTEYGLKHVVSVTPIEHNGFLYNLETTEHVYRVGSLGTLVHNSCVIHGNPQFTSPAHARAMQDMANRMAKSGAYTDVYMHSRWTTILQGKGTTVSPSRLPDIAGVRLDGKIDIIEFASSIDDKPSKIFRRNQAIWNQLPQHLRGDILVYDHLGNWIHAFP